MGRCADFGRDPAAGPMRPRRPHDGIDGSLGRIEPDHDAGEGGDQQKQGCVDADRLVGIEAHAKPRTGQANRRLRQACQNTSDTWRGCFLSSPDSALAEEKT